MHVAAHIFNIVTLSNTRHVNLAHPTLITGIFLVLMLLAVAITAYCEPIRRRTFEVFYYVHYLAALSMILIFIHGLWCFIRTSTGRCAGSTTIYWLALPALLYCVDQMFALYRGTRFVYISKVIENPSQVLEVQFRRPGFIFLPGQYAYIKCPALSLLQWHPFTLTSAPEEDHLSIHMRIVGNWTKRFADLLKKRPLEEIRVLLDGPYGCASQDYEKYSAVICIGAGIGQTPFASIMKSLWYTCWAAIMLSSLLL